MKIITKTAAQYHPRAAVVSLTDDCNLRCVYCFNDFKRRESTFEIVDQTCKFLLQNLEEGAAHPTLAFFGGEPLLKFKDIIVPIVEKYRGQIDFTITTNGVLLTEGVVDFLADNNVPVLLSIDGAPKTQNRQRPCKGGGESAKLVEKNIPYLLVRMPYTVFRATLTPSAVPDLYDNFKYAEMLGFKHFTFIPNVEDDWSKVDPKLLENQLKIIAIEAAQAFSEGKLPKTTLDNFSTAIDLFKRSIEVGRGVSTTVSRCGLCTTSMGVDVLGNIHACQENNSVLTDEPLGNVFSGIDHTKHATFLSKFREGFDGFAEKVYKEYNQGECRVHGGYFPIFLINSCCPKKLYDGGKYSLFEGWVYYTKALFNAAYPLYQLYRWSANPAAMTYLGIREEADNA